MSTVKILFLPAFFMLGWLLCGVFVKNIPHDEYPAFTDIPAQNEKSNDPLVFNLLNPCADKDITSEISKLSPVRSQAEIDVLLRRLAAINPTLAIKVLNSLNLPAELNYVTQNSELLRYKPYDTLLNSILATWGKVQPLEVTHWILQNVKKEVHLNAETVTILAEHDAYSAAQTVLAVSQDMVAGGLMGVIFPELLKTSDGTKHCCEIAMTLADRCPSSGILEGLFTKWNKVNPSAANLWMESIPDRFLVGDQAASLASLVASVSPKTGMALSLRSLSGRLDSEEFRDKFQSLLDNGFESNLRSGSASDFATQRFISNYGKWASEDREGAGTWLNNLPESPAKMALLSQTPASLAPKDIPAAVISLNSLPDSIRSGAVRSLAFATAHEGIESSMNLARQINDNATRDTYLEISLNRLIKIHPAYVRENLHLIGNPNIRQGLFSKIALK